jgi:Type II secretion system protein B
MSYILDALRKAEQKRQLAAKVPTLATVHRHPAAVRPPIRMRLWPWVAGAVIVVNAGVATWLLLPAGTRSTASLDRPGSFSTPGTAAPPAPAATAPPAPGPQAAPPTVGAPALSAPTPPPAPATTGRPVAAPPTPAAVRGAGAEPGRATTKPAETKSEARPAPPQAATRPAQPTPDRPTPDQKNPPPAVASVPPASLPAAGKSVPAQRPSVTPAVPERAAPSPDRPAVGAIPPANQARPAERAPGSPGTAPQGNPQGVQDMVSKLKLQMVVYSDVPSERLVFINNQKYVEGSSIDGTLRVESITPDGAVLSHQGQRFVIRQ